MSPEDKRKSKYGEKNQGDYLMNAKRRKATSSNVRSFADCLQRLSLLNGNNDFH
jgi:hypothetical protein